MSATELPFLDPQAREQLLEEALLAYLDAKQSGPVDKHALQTRYAPVAAELAAFFAAEEAVGAALSPPSTGQAAAGTPGSLAAAGSAPEGGLQPFGKYADFAVISSGGMGTVYRCRDTELGRSLAMKVMHPQLARVPERVEDFQEEVQVASQLTHPNIAPVHEHGVLPDQRPYFTMKLVEGRTFTDLIREYHKTPTAARFDALLRHFVAVCNALAYAHQRQVLHRDLKPDNVMVGAFGEVQVMDWGLSKVVRTAPEGVTAASLPDPVAAVRLGGQESPTEPGLVRGTFAYMSPEQAEPGSRKLDARCDVFALGALLCEIMTDTPPYTSGQKDLKQRRHELWEAARTCATGSVFARLDTCDNPAELVALAKKCLAKEPDERPASATVVADGVTGYLAGVQEKLRAAEVKRARAEAKAAEERKKRRWQIGLAAVVLLAVGCGVAGWLWYKGEQERSQQEAEAATKQELALARGQLQARWPAPVPNLVPTATAAAATVRQAVEIARRGPVSLDLLGEAEAALLAAEKESAATRRDAALLAQLLNPSDILEHIAVQRLRNPKGTDDSSATDRNYTAAFRAWGVDLDTDDPATVATKIKARPPAVVEEISAGLHTWAVFRRREVPRANSQRLLDVASLIDPDPRRTELRKFLASSPLIPRTRSTGPPADRLPDELEVERKKLAALAEASDPVRDPVLTIVLLATTLESAGNSPAAEQLLRKAVATRPTEPILLDQLAFVLIRGVTAEWGSKAPDLSAVAGLMGKEGVSSPLAAFSFLLTPEQATRAQEAVGYLRAVRAVRPESGLMLGFALLLTRQASEGEGLIRQFNVRLQSPDLTAGMTVAEVLGLVLQGKLDAAEAILRNVIAHPPIKGDSITLFYDLLATVLEGKQKPKEAETVYREALAKFPDDYMLNHHFGEVLIRQGRVDQALSFLVVASRNAPKSTKNYPSGYAVAATLLLKQKREADAILMLRRGFTADPTDERSGVALARLLGKTGRYDEAVMAYRTVTGLNPRNLDALRALADVLKTQDKIKEAATTWKQAFDLDPKDARVCGELAWALQRSGDNAQAEVYARKSLAINPEEYLAHAALAFASYESKKYPEAAAAWENVVRMRPRLAEGFLMLGASYAQLTQLPQAEKAYRRAVELNPEESNRKLYVAVLARQKKWDLVEAESRAALARNPASGTGYAWRGMAQAGRGEWPAADGSFRKALDFGADRDRVLAEHGHVLWELGREEAAEEAFRAAHGIAPEVTSEAVGLRFLGMTVDVARLFREGNDPEAEKLQRQLVAFEPKDSAARYLLGLILFVQQKYDRAEKQFRAAVALEPKNAEAHLHLGHVLVERGHYAEAIAAFQRAHDIGSKTKDWKHDTPALIKKCERFVALDKLLPDVVAGKHLFKDKIEKVELASLCLLPCRKRYVLASKLYADVLADDPTPEYGQRYNAACAAVLASAGQGIDGEKLTPADRQKWQAQARAWLAAELRRVQDDSRTADTAKKKELANRLKHWQTDSDLAPIREPASLAKLSEAERQQWQQFWADVDALRKKLDSPAPKK